MKDAHLELMEQLALAGRRAVSGGLVIGSGGNVSARVPSADECIMSATGTWLDALGPADFSLVGLDGTVRDGHGKPSSELPLHLASYRARPDVNAVIHLHPQYCVLLTALGHPIRLITTDQAYYVREIATTPWIPSGTQELAAASAAALDGGCNCVVLGNHGCSVVADSVELAYKRAANLEEASVATYHALLLGDRDTVCPPGYLERIRAIEAAGTAGRH